MMEIDESTYAYFMNLENEKQKDVVTIQRLLNRVKELEEKVKEVEE